MRRVLKIFLLTLLLPGCTAVPSWTERRNQADQMAVAHHWHAVVLNAGTFELLAYVPRAFAQDDRLTVYIEGDGLAWITESMPSADPTPRNPLALRLALAHPKGNVAYLARLCQYIGAQKAGCAKRYWTHSRFAAEVITATDWALDDLKRQSGAQGLVLVGYSGGGAVAALLAARRNDVTHLITVAGNLDHPAWTAHHRVAPLSGSLNPADLAAGLVKVAQTHFVGASDGVIPPELAIRWPLLLRGQNNANLKIVPHHDHDCCWVETWSDLLQSTTVR